MVVARILLKAHPAFRAQAFTVFPAHRLERQRSYHCVPEYRLEINTIMLDPVLLFPFFLGDLTKVSIPVVEEFLHVDVEVIRDGVQAAPALARYFNGSGAGDQDTFVHGLEPQVQLHVGAFPNADECHTKILWCGYMLIKGPHRSRAAPELLYPQDQGRTLIMAQDHGDEDSS